MKKHAMRSIKGFYEDEKLFSMLAWTVHESLSLDGATKDDIRRRFRHWVQNDAEPDPTDFPTDIGPRYANLNLIGHARMRYCIHVNAECFASIPRYEHRLGTRHWDSAGGFVDLI